jgi:hypothetical protein
LFDASGRTEDGGVLLLPFAEQDPFLPVYGAQVDDEERVLAGELFQMEDETIVLEPGESVDTELAFPLERQPLALLAMRARIQGYERRDRKRPWVWSGFYYLDPSRLTTQLPVGLAGGMIRTDESGGRL